MAVTLTKIVDAKTAQPYTFTNALTVRCPRCEQTYWFGYSDEEWRKLRHWRELAAKALRRDHDSRHEAATIPLAWRAIRRR